MKRRRTIYEGKAKILYEGPEPGTLVQYFKDDTTAFDAKNPQLFFSADGEAKELAASPELRAAADRWVRPLYEELRAC